MAKNDLQNALDLLVLKSLSILPPPPNSHREQLIYTGDGAAETWLELKAGNGLF